MTEKQLKELGSRLAIKAQLDNLVNGSPKKDTIMCLAMIEYIRFLKKKEKKLIKYIEDTTTKNDELGCTKILSVRQVQHVLKTLKKDWKEADADENNNKSNTN